MPLTSLRHLPGVTCVSLLLLLLVVIAPEARAHARLVRSEPAKEAEVSATPERVDLWFNELLEDGFHSVKIFPASELAAKKRSDLVLDKPRVDPGDRTRLSVKLGPLAAGEYVVEWRVLSRDGHSAPGRFTFRIRSR